MLDLFVGLLRRYKMSKNKKRKDQKKKKQQQPQIVPKSKK